jgi:hypothetical protein
MSKMTAQQRLDAVARKIADTYHVDVAESVMIARELLNVRAQAFEVQYPEHKAMSLVPMKTDIHPGDELYTYQVWDKVGQAAFRTPHAKTAPRADVSLVEGTPLPLRSIHSSYGIDFQEARAAARAGKPLDNRKMMAARYAIASKLNSVFTSGSTEYGPTMYGMLNLSGVVTYTVTADGTGATKTWSTKTPAQIVRDMNGIVTKMVVDSNDVEHPDTLVIPLSSHELISTTRMADGSDVTILKHFLANSPHIKRVIPWYALETAGTGGRMIAYRQSADVLEGLLPVEFEQFAPQTDGMEVVTVCHARMGGICLYKPKAVAYGDGIVS